MSNTSTILAHLNLPKYEEVRNKLRADTLKWAKNSLSGFLEQVEKLTEDKLAEFDDLNRSYMRFRPQFPDLGVTSLFLAGDPFKAVREKISAKFNGVRGNGYSAFKRETILALKDTFSMDEAKIQRHADSQWEQHKAFYAARVGEKITDLLEGDAEISCDLSLTAALVGRVKAVLNGKTLTLTTSLKTNYRYGENAANKEMTVYRQVPTLIESASGFDPVVRQKEIDAKAAQAKNDRKTAIQDLQKEIVALERRKRRWDDIYSTLSFCAKTSVGVPTNGNLASINTNAKELGLTEMPSLAFAKATVKELRQKVKDAKAKLKEARAGVVHA